ncbi:ankyrin repeat-containing domain protein [Ilyonectria destructans]|nr:ankyrin repeat-containing domain protein [Ilyonectria destructans]
MDPLSLTASVIAVVQVAQAVLLACYRIRSQVKDADDDIVRIITDIEGLESTLQGLHDILPRDDGQALDGLSLDDDGHKRPASAACLSALRACEVLMKEISQQLQPLAKPGPTMWLRWPFESSVILQKVEEISKLKGTLHLALSAYQTRVLNQLSQKFEDLQATSKRAAILSWYKTSDPEQNHKVSRSRHEPYTSRWIFQAKEFRSWTDTPGESLWLRGIPGAGKTILCSTIIDHVLQQWNHKPGVKVAYFYFDFSDLKKQNVAGFLKSVVYQLIFSEPTISDSAAALYDKCNGVTEPGLDELLAVIMTEISSSERTFLLIDALDECPKDERPVFFDTLFNSKSPLPSNLSLLITSRRESDIEAVLQPSMSNTVWIQSSVVDADVRIHVSNSISRDSRLSRWKPAVRDEMLDAIVKGSNGMFRWAVCQLDTMRKCLTPAMVHAELRRMPETLDQTYDRILQQVPKLHQPFVQSALHWLAFSARPLQIQELAEAAVVQPDGEDFDVERARFFDQNMITELCGPLVTSSTIDHRRGVKNWLTDKIDTEMGYSSASLPQGTSSTFTVVSLSHFSVKEYMLSPRLGKGALANYQTSERLANAALARSCLFYLLHYNSGEIAPKLEFNEWPLLEYAARNWMSHWHLAGVENQQSPELHDTAQCFFDPQSSHAYVNWLNVSVPDAMPLGDSTSSHHCREMRTSAHNYHQPLYWAASIGNLALVEWLLAKGAEVSSREGQLGSALGAAAFHGHANVVECLLEHGADPNLADSEFGNVLQVAALGGSIEAVKQLLDAGAVVNALGGAYNTALVAATSKEHHDVVALLIKNGADTSIGSHEHGSSLYQAALVGDTSTVMTLLGAGADINELQDSDGTALYAASLRGSVPLVELLLRKGADVNKGGRGEFGYPISVAAAGGHAQVVRILTEAGAEVNVLGGHRGVTALEAAVESRDMATFLAVLETGADPNREGSQYRNCFHAAIWTGETEMAKILLDRDVEFEDVAFLTAVGLYNDHPYFLERLLERNGNLDAWDKSDGSALHKAVKEKSPGAFTLLLNKGAYIDAMAEDGSVLFYVIKQQMFDAAKDLLHRGANPNRFTKTQTPFTLAIFHACIDRELLGLADLLLDKGADVNGGNGLAVYWAAMFDESGYVLRYLVKKGANLDLVNYREECTALQGVAKAGTKAMFNLLLELGADINGPLGDEGYVIHYAIRSTDESMVKHVLDRGATIDDSVEHCSSIQKAASGNRGFLVQLLLDHGADIRACSPAEAMGSWKKDKATYRLLIERGGVLKHSDAGPFVELIEDDAMEDVKEMLADGMDPNCHTTHQSPILEAATTGQKDIVELLLSFGADINYAPDEVYNALTGSCLSSDMDMAKFLLEHGADPNALSQECVSPLSAAASTEGNIELVELLLEHGADLHTAGEYTFQQVISGDEEILTCLFAQPMTATQRERYLNAALQHAVHWAVLDLVVWLLDQGANPNYRGGDFGCPLTAAVSNMHVCEASEMNNRHLILDLLLERGADPNPPPLRNAAPNLDIDLKAAFHPPPLTAALTHRAAWAAKALLAAGADPNLDGGELPSALQAAARYCREMVQPLLDAGADARAISAEGPFRTALHAAAYAHHDEAIAALLAAGADVSDGGRAKYGSPLQASAKLETTTNGWSAGRDSLRCLKILAASTGADVHAAVTVQGGKYGTIAQMAAKSGNIEVLKWLVEDVGLSKAEIVGVKGGRFGSVRAAAVRKGQWGVVTYLERKFGRFAWEGIYQSETRWKEFVVVEEEEESERGESGPA